MELLSVEDTNPHPGMILSQFPLRRQFFARRNPV